MTRSVVASVAVVMAALLIFIAATPDVVAATSIFQEEPCSREGGICALESTCPLDKLHPTKGLCPSQQSQGVECCRGVPSDRTDCRRRGGECIPTEGCRGIKDRVGVCQDGEVCCILL